MLSQHTESHAQALFAGAAILALAAGQSWIKNHLGADLDAVDTVSDRVHDSSSVRTADVGQFDRDAGYPLEDEEIEMVESGGFQPHPHLTLSGLGFRPVTVEQLVGPAMLFEVQSFHRYLLCADIVTAIGSHWPLASDKLEVQIAIAIGIAIAIDGNRCNLVVRPRARTRARARGWLLGFAHSPSQQNPAEAGFCGSTGGYRSGTLIVENKGSLTDDSPAAKIIVGPYNEVVLAVGKIGDSSIELVTETAVCCKEGRQPRIEIFQTR